MNFCTKCESYYQHPGTCNCFASQQKLWPFDPGIIRYPTYPETPAPPLPQDGMGDWVPMPVKITSGAVLCDPTIPVNPAWENSFEPMN